MDRITEVGEQLRHAFGALIAAFPGTAKSVADMTRWLGIGRAACQRVVLGIRSDASPLEVVERFPGEKGLRSFLEAVERKGIAPHLIQDAFKALEGYARLVGEAGGSRARLVTHIVRARESNHDPSHADLDDEADLGQLREQSYTFAQKAAGLWQQARVDVHLIRKMPGQPDMLEHAATTGFIGVQAVEESIPLIHQTSVRSSSVVSGMENWPHSHTGITSLVEGEPKRGVTPSILLSEFSTMPPPKITMRNAMGRLLQVFDLEGGSKRPVDVVIGTLLSPSGQHPALDEGDDYGDGIYSLGTIVTFPTRNLLIDIYLEKDLAQTSIPDFGVFRIGFAGAEMGNPWARWYDRLPERLILNHLGIGLGNVPHPTYSRIREVTEHLATELGWSNDEYYGYRLAVPYPIWGMQYMVAFNFARPGQD
jgi:hypothetical protein